RHWIGGSTIGAIPSTTAWPTTPRWPRSASTPGSGTCSRERAADKGRNARRFTRPLRQPMTSLAQALQHFHSRRLQEAESVGRRLVEGDPSDAAALHLLGVLAHQSGRPEAVELISQAVALEPGNAEYHYNLGVALQQRGRHDHAAASYRQALGLQPHR